MRLCARAGCQCRRAADGIAQRGAMRFGGAPDVRMAAAERRDLRLAQRAARFHQPVECFAVAPIELIDRPRHDGRLRQPLHSSRLRAFERFRQRIAAGRELGERKLIQPVDLGLERHHDIM